VKHLIVMICALLILLATGCNNLVDLTTERTTTTTTKTIKEKGKPDVIVVVVVSVLKNFNIVDKSFTVGTKGLGTYYFSLCRDLKLL